MSMKTMNIYISFYELCVKTSILHVYFRFRPLPRLWPFPISNGCSKNPTKTQNKCISYKLYNIWQWKCIGSLSKNNFLALNTFFVHTMDHIHCRCVWLLSTYGFGIVRLAVFCMSRSWVFILRLFIWYSDEIYCWTIFVGYFFFSSLPFLHFEDTARRECTKWECKISSSTWP